MSIIECPKCRDRVSDLLPACASCGSPLGDSQTEPAPKESTPVVKKSNWLAALLRRPSRDSAESPAQPAKACLSQPHTVDWRGSSAHLLLLSKFRAGESPDRFIGSDDWEAVLRETPTAAISRFLGEDAVRKADLRELVTYKFKVTELKSILRERGLKVSGAKDEFVCLLVESCPREMLEMTRDLVLYRCTTQGNQISDEFLQREKQLLDTAKSDSLELVSRSDFAAAARRVATYEASQVFPRGVGIDWSCRDITRSVADLQVIATETPSILRGIPEDQLTTLRLAASMQLLWGTSSAREWLPQDFTTGIHLDGDTAARMFLFYSAHKWNIQDYKEAGVKTVEIMIVDDGSTCPQCRKLEGKIVRIAQVPELPYPSCSCEFGCRCTALAGEFS